MDGFHPFPLFEFEFHGAINVTTPSKLNQSWIQFARSLSADFWARLIDSVADSSSELFHWVIESRAMELPFPLFPFLFLFYFPNSGSSHVIQLSGFIARLSISFERDAFINRVWLELHGGAFLFFVCLELNRSGGACNQKTIQCNPKNNPAATWFHWLENWPVGRTAIARLQSPPIGTVWHSNSHHSFHRWRSKPSVLPPWSSGTPPPSHLSPTEQFQSNNSTSPSNKWRMNGRKMNQSEPWIWFHLISETSIQRSVPGHRSSFGFPVRIATKTSIHVYSIEIKRMGRGRPFPKHEKIKGFQQFPFFFFHYYYCSFSFLFFFLSFMIWLLTSFCLPFGKGQRTTRNREPPFFFLFRSTERDAGARCVSPASFY